MVELVEGPLPRLPLSLAESAGLQSLNHAQRFFSRTSHVQIVHDFVTKNAFRIDHEETAQRDAATLDQNAIVARNFLRCVSSQRVFQSFYSALVARCIKPGAVRINRVS